MTKEFAEHSQNTFIKQLHNSTIQNGLKTIIGHFRNSYARQKTKGFIIKRKQRHSPTEAKPSKIIFLGMAVVDFNKFRACEIFVLL